MHWIFLRGLGREAGHWGDFISRCEARLGCTGVSLDFPGAGEFYRERSPTSVAGIVLHLRQQLRERVAPGEPLVLVGLSMGAMAALELALAESERVKALVLINPSSRLNRFYQRLRWRSFMPVVKNLLDSNTLRCERRILRMVSNDEQVRRKLLAPWCEIQQARPVAKKNLIAQLRAASGYRLSQAPAAPTRILYSRRDRMVDRQCSQTLAAYLSCEARAHEDAGHDLPADDAEWVIEQLKDVPLAQ
ncbi:alpha/beta fold hydrolase [Gilvimarinus xylanilyticus]|uniref:Alpha/beta hydrolase n=1 Tax=Gilvimarinus xylanilyticus TaxID=2944139 RepID=A0A9X2KTQ0_9GAMM|nr:alpha/beta hydrolase [Gilvimarinus xylanilyticus]MCP8899519.1 alpha/beta hydrolase [Gilvimarinus xylanilyticus]